MSSSTLEIIDKVGEGDLMEVFLARWNSSGARTLVTARRLLRQTASVPECLSSLQAASMKVRRIQHPRLLAHLGLFQAGDDYYWVSERPEGYDLSSLANRLQSREVRIQPIRSLQMGLDFLEGLERLHQLGEAHGGIDPSYLVVDFEGVTRLDGVGLESALLSVKALKQKARRGRGDFLAPEVMQGRNPSPASDVFSAAAILYLLLTGSPPFGRKDRSGVQSAVRHVAIPAPSKIERSLPFTCDAVFLRALNLSTSQRHENAAALRGALASLRAAMLHGPDEGRQGVLEFLETAFPNEALVPGRRGTAQRPAQGEPIPLSGEAAPLPSPEEKIPTATERSPAPAAAFARLRPAAAPVPESPAPPAEREAGSSEPWNEPTPIAAPPDTPSAAEPVTAVGLQPPAGMAAGEPEPEGIAPEPSEPAPEAHEDTDEVVAVPAPAPPPRAGERSPGGASSHARIDWQRGLLVLLSLAVLGLLGALLFGTGQTEPERKETPLAFLTVEAAQPVLVVLDDELLQGDDPARHRLLRVGEHRLVIKTPDGLPLVEQTFSAVPGEHRVVTVPAYSAAPRVAPKTLLDKPPEPAPSPKVKPKPPANPKRKRPGRR